MRHATGQRRDTKGRIEGPEGSFLGAGAFVRGYGERNAWSRCAAVDGAVSDVESESMCS